MACVFGWVLDGFMVVLSEPWFLKGRHPRGYRWRTSIQQTVVLPRSSLEWKPSISTSAAVPWDWGKK